jgi:undecaprenyl-diphosphatase
LSRRQITVLLVVVAVLFIPLALLAHFNTLLPGDEAISSWVQGLDSPLVDGLLRVASFTGDTWPALATVAVLTLYLLYRKRRLEALFVAAVPALTALLNYLTKNLVDRARPGDDPLGGGLSFPSGHTTYALVFFGLLAFLALRLIKKASIVRLVQVLIVLLVTLVALSRIYLEAHWPSDVLGSFLFGGMLLILAILIYKMVSKENDDARTA